MLRSIVHYELARIVLVPIAHGGGVFFDYLVMIGRDGCRAKLIHIQNSGLRHVDGLPRGEGRTAPAGPAASKVASRGTTGRRIGQRGDFGVHFMPSTQSSSLRVPVCQCLTTIVSSHAYVQYRLPNDVAAAAAASLLLPDNLLLFAAIQSAFAICGG